MGEYWYPIGSQVSHSACTSTGAVSIGCSRADDTGGGKEATITKPLPGRLGRGYAFTARSFWPWLYLPQFIEVCNQIESLASIVWIAMLSEFAYEEFMFFIHVFI